MKVLYRLALCACAIFSSGIISVTAQSAETDSLALVDLYNDCGGAEWVGFDTWLTGPLSTWEKVTLDSASGRVSNVEFKDMHLTGTLPESLGDLTEMSGKIEMRDDEITGALPSFLWKWTKVDRFQVKFSGYTSIDTEGLENMVNLTEFNTEGTPFAGMIPGVLFTLPAMEKLYFHDSDFDAVPPEITSATKLDRLYLNGDKISDLPDLSGMTWGSGAKIRVHENLLTFEDLEPNVVIAADTNVAEFSYSPQAIVGEESYLYPETASSVSLDAEMGGTANIYTWIKGVDEVVGDSSALNIASFDPAVNSGKYMALVQNTIVQGLDILTAPTHLYSSPVAQDSLALVDLYNDCGGADWVGFDTWLNGPLSTWERVTVDSASGRVSNVEFKDMHLTGTLPESLGNLTEMSGKIEMRDDEITGALPSFLWKWTKVDRFQVKFSGYTSIDTKGLENMVNLTEFNTEGTPFEGMIPGVLFTLPAMEKLYFHDSEFDAVPPEITLATKLDRLYLNGDKIYDLPDLSGMTWGSGAKIRVHENLLTFEDLEPNVVIAADTNVAEFSYSPQAIVGEETYLYPETDSSVSLDAEMGGTANIYTWIKGVDEVVGDSSVLNIASFDPAVNSGKYMALVQNTIVPGLDIITAPTHLFSSAVSQDSLALVALYQNNNGANWTGFDTWLNGPLNTWELVTVDSVSGRVTNVEFKDMDLTGTLTEALGDLTEMSGKVEFRDDSLLTGALPSFFWKWTKLERFQVKFSGYTSIDTDGLENMVNLTEFNTEGSPIGGMIPGVLFTLPAMEKLYFHDSEFDAVPPEITSATKLDRLYLNGDNISVLPDLSGMTWGSGAKIRVHENFLTFEDLEPNVVITSDTAVAEFSYSPQGNVGMETELNVATGDTVTMSVEVGGSANIYTWIRGEDEVVGPDASIYQIDSVTVSHIGDYRVLVQNSLVPGLDISSEVFHVIVDGTTGIDEAYFGDIRVLGNPVGSDLRIEAEKIIDRVSIFDVSGKAIEHRALKSSTISIPVDHYQAGIYFVTLQSADKYYTLRVVKR